MTITLLVAATIVAANPFRAAAAAPTHGRHPAALVAVGTSLALVFGTALLSGPLREAVDISGSSARIAAGVALVAVCLKDLLGPPPATEPALRAWRGGFVPLAFPVIFNPALALIVVAGASDRGVALMLGATTPALALTGAAIALASRRGLRVLLATVAAAGVGIGALVTLDGVYAI